MELTTIVLIAAVVMLTGISKSAFAGALGVFSVPLLMLKLPATEAIALMLPILIIGDMLSVRSFWGKWDKSLLLPLIPGAITGVFIAYLIIDFINSEYLQLIVAAICILFALRNLFFTQTKMAFLNNKVGGLFMSMFSGITSSLVHAGGPPIIIYFSAIGLTPAKFVGTAAVFFAMLNVFKLVGALSFGVLTGATALTALMFFPLAFIGNWLGVKINSSLDKVLFLRIMNYLLLVLGFCLIIK